MLLVGAVTLIPWIDVLITLVSSITTVPIVLIFPAVIDTAINWETDSKVVFYMRYAKNLAIVLFGVFLMVSGAYVSILALARRTPSSLI